MKRILIADDHDTVRSGLRALLEAHVGWEVVAEARDGKAAVAEAFEKRPDIAIIDHSMPLMTGVEVARRIRDQQLPTEILIFTMHNSNALALEAFEAGARAYLLKGLLRKELLDTIRAVHAGHKRVSSEVAAEIAEHATDDALTPREGDVLRLVARGNANKAIAAQLSLTEETVKSHIRSILAKLGANDRTHAVAIGLKRGIIEL